MNSVILNFRPGEYRYYYLGNPGVELRVQDRLYIVALVETPPFPGENFEESRNLAVICASQYKTLLYPIVKWGWVHLGADTKEDIGDDLEMIFGDDLKPGQWVYLVVSPSDTAPTGELASSLSLSTHTVSLEEARDEEPAG